MAASLKKWPQHAVAQTNRIDRVFSEIRAIASPQIQFLLGEILVIRTAQILEEILPEIFARLVCNTPYIDGSVPIVLSHAKRIDEAFALIRSHRRKKKLNILKWLQSTEIRTNLKHLLDVNDHSLQIADRFSAELDEIRIVRNEAAHRVAGTKNQYRKIMLAYYGSSRIAVPVGKFVISDQRVKPAPLMKYTATVRTFVRDLCKG